MDGERGRWKKVDEKTERRELDRDAPRRAVTSVYVYVIGASEDTSAAVHRIMTD